jgi:hypothetical protein
VSQDFPRRPRTFKGMLVAIDPNSQSAIINANSPFFVFQYNPDKLTRTISYLNPDGTIANETNIRYVQGTQRAELICLTLELDVADLLEQPEKNVTIAENGLHPFLAVLESMMDSAFTENKQVIPQLILFSWGPKRLLPVSMVSLKISEDAFDASLNPIRAKIDLCMRRLSVSELKKDALSYKIYENNSSLKAALALLYRQSIAGNTFLNQVSNIKETEDPTKSEANKTNSSIKA